MPLILGTNSIKDTGFNVDNSVRLNQGDHAHFSKTPSTSNGTTFTYSFWVKRGRVDVNSFMLRMVASDLSEVDLLFESGGTIRIQDYHGPSGTNNWKYITNRLFRDPSAWYHILYVVDTNNGTASDRVQLYINGVRETSFSSTTNPSSGDTSALSKGEARGIGGQVGGSTNSFDGYMAEVVYVDGTAKSTTDFGEFDEDTGIWKPIDVSDMSLGSNGWYLDFEDSSSLGNDASGSNNWTSNNLTSIDQTTDTPTNNYATWNPLMSLSISGNTFPTALTDGNTINSDTRLGGDARSLSTIAVPRTNKWYYECKVISGGTYISVGLFQYLGNAIPTKWVRYYGASGIKNLDGTSTSYGATFTNGDIIGCLADIENNQITFYKNGTSQGTISYTFASGEDYFMTAGDEAGTSHSVAGNFGNPAFTISSGNSDPNGYGNFEYSTNGGYALNTKNLAEYG